MKWLRKSYYQWELDILIPGPVSTGLLLCPLTNSQVSKNKKFPVLQPKRNRRWHDLQCPKYLLNTKGNLSWWRCSESIWFHLPTDCQEEATGKQIPLCVCTCPQAQLCRALRTVQTTVLPKEAARKAPGALPVSFPAQVSPPAPARAGNTRAALGALSSGSTRQLLGFPRSGPATVIDADPKHGKELIQTSLPHGED